MPIWITLLVSAIAPAVPGLLNLVPAHYSAIASGFLSLAASLYHLYQEIPGSNQAGK